MAPDNGRPFLKLSIIAIIKYIRLLRVYSKFIIIFLTNDRT
jgi:hypothetical protein